MKKIILFFAFMNASIAFCQKFEISASYGAPSIYGLTNELGSDLASAITKDGETPNSIGALNAAVMAYNANMRWRYGLDFVNEFYSTKNTDYKKKSTISIMPRVDYFWSGKDKKLRLYSSVSAGVYLNRTVIYNSENIGEKLNESTFGFNVTPIALRYGSDFAVFIEPNIGTKGILQAGVSFVL